MVFLPRVEALRTSTLGYEIATPTELLLLAGHNSSLMMPPPRAMHGCQGKGKQLQGPVYAIHKVMEIMIKHIIYNWYAFSPLGESQRGASYDGRCASILAYNCARCHYFGDFNNYYKFNIGGVPFFHEFCSCYNHYRQQNFNSTHGCHARCRSNFIHAHYEMRHYCHPYPPPCCGAQPLRYSVAGSHHP